MQTPRLRLTRFDESLLTSRYVAWLNDPEVVRFSEQRHIRHSIDSCRDYVHSYIGSPHRLWALVTRDGQSRHIGNINAYIDVPNRVADVGILIGERSAWGHGFGTEAFSTVCAYLLTQLHMRKVSAGAMAGNRAMIAIMDNIGMQPDGVRIGQLLLDGEPTDVVHFALWNDETMKQAPN